jgi:hypothetical protein
VECGEDGIDDLLVVKEASDGPVEILEQLYRLQGADNGVESVD